MTPQLPTTLYKYVVPERLDILKRGRVRFTPPAAFNDPLEMSPVFTSIFRPGELSRRSAQDLDRDLQERHERLPPAIQKLLPLERLRATITPERLAAAMERAEPQVSRTTSAMFAQALSGHIGVLSLAADPVHPLMWGHYARSHEGFAIQLDTRHPFFDQRKSEQDVLRHLRQVRYSRERPAKPLHDMTEQDMFLTKSDHWAYENEWRMLLPLADCAERIEVGSGAPDICLFDLPREAIVGIILGARAGSQLEGQIVKDVESQKQLRHVRLSRVVVDQREFALRIEAV